MWMIISPILLAAAVYALAMQIVENITISLIGPEESEDEPRK